jgi:hypothetical protein
MGLPKPTLPNVKTPRIRRIPSLPGGIGCAGGNPSSYVGNQFGNQPDVAALLHLKALKKLINDNIGTLIDGYLPTVLRKPKYVVRVVKLTKEVEKVVRQIADTVASAQAEYNAQLAYVNQVIGEVNSAAAEINTLPASARSQAQNHLLNRYNEYAADLNAQAGRIQQALRCL